MRTFRFSPRRKRDNPESRLVQTPILQYLRFMGVYCYHHKNHGIKIKKAGRDVWLPGSQQGIPDIIGFLGPRWGRFKGRFVAIECKYGKNTVSTEQALFLEDAKNSGCVSILAYKVEDVQIVLEALQKEAFKAEVGS